MDVLSSSNRIFMTLVSDWWQVPVFMPDAALTPYPAYKTN